jgi:RNA polymerase sigma factor (sigma-70 family)
MQPENEELIPTRASLIHRLQDWQDQSSWQEFFNIYWNLIYSVARKAGLTDAEAQDAVQETLISVAKHMPTFRYDPSIGSFKAWLLNMTRWRIIGLLRKRRGAAANRPAREASSAHTGTMEALPDPAVPAMDELWEAEWKSTLFNAALEHVKRRSDPQKFQIFDFYVNKEWAPEKIAGTFGISVNQVYQTKHRVTEALREEVERLEKEMV